jgi:hypothetical protein
MDGAALARVLNVAGHPSPSHCCRPIVVIQSPLSNCHPQILTLVFIDILAVGGGGGGINAIAVAVAVAVTIAITITVAVAVATSIIAVITIIAVIVDVHRCCPILVVKSPSPNRHPLIAAVIAINIVPVDGSSGITATDIAVTVAVSAIIVAAVIVGVHHHCPIVIVLLLLSNCHP